jgi:hypothetical protein
MKVGLKKQMADKVMGLLVDATGHSMALDSEDMEQPVKNVNTCTIFCGVAGHKTRRAKICLRVLWSWPKAEVEA